MGAGQVYNFIARHILAPVLDFSRGTRTMKCLKELEQSQWWPRDKIVELQNQRLRQLVRHAYGKVPYYRRLFDDRGLKPNDIERAEDLVKLPILTKQLIRNNFDNLVTPGFPAKDLVPNCTGGSTGEPLIFYSTRDDHYNWGFAAGQRAYRWAGNELGEKCVWLRWVRPYRSKMEKLRETAARFFERILFLDAREMSVESLLLFVRKLEDFQPAFIRGYPSAIYLLARFIEREGKPRLRPKAIITTSEQLYDYQRDLFSKVFQCETYNHYNSWELHTIATECPEHSGYHIAAENVIVEIADDKGRPIPVGGEGSVLITNLHNYAMPFIRYDMGDLGVSSDRACPCGRGLPLLATLNGRKCDIIFTRSGKSIPGISIPKEFLAPFGVEQIQIVQETYERVVVKLVLGREYPAEHLDKLTREVISQYQPLFGEDVDIIIELVDQIPLTRAGKRRVVISNLPQRGR
jgi:phenylacetate-CoA ligase